MISESKLSSMPMFLVAIAMLAVISGPWAAGETPRAADHLNNDQGFQSSPKLVAAAAPLPGEDTAAEAALLESVNRSRVQAGVLPLRVEESLRQAARGHAGSMVANQRLEHQFPGEPSLLQRIADVSLLPLDRAGENIANATSPDDAHETLMRSPPHRENLLDARFNAVGIAAVWSQGRLYVVQDFAHTVPSYSPRQTSKLVGQAVGEARLSAGFDELAQFTSPRLDDAACSLAKQDHPNARLIAASFADRKTITYTQTRPEILPSEARRLLDDPSLRQFAVGSCYARNAAYPNGIYWVAILLY